MQDVLLVEDNPADIYLTQAAIAECDPDIRLWLVTNGLDALTFLRKEGHYIHAPSPALIILDINLPRMHGTEALAELRALPTYQTTPTVIFTSARKDLEEPRCLQLGANAYVQKPLDYGGFLAAIRAIIAQWLPPQGAHSSSL